MASGKESTVSGLGCLQYLAEVHVHQKANAGGNKYLVLTPKGCELFEMTEDGHMFTFLRSGRSRSFQMDAVDQQGVMSFSLRRKDNQVECFMDRKRVSIIRKQITFLKPVFTINDADDWPVLRVKGSLADYAYQFELQSVDKKPIGSISKKFRGLLTEMFTYVDSYVVSFPADLDVRFKVATISACILIDYKFHEG